VQVYRLTVANVGSWPFGLSLGTDTVVAAQ
jgi:hypothetical protein